MRKKIAYRSFNTRASSFDWLSGDLVDKEAVVMDDYALAKSINKINPNLLLLDDCPSRIHPKIYSELSVDEDTVYNTDRDKSDIRALKAAVKDGRNIIAIGRSAHLVCAAAGGYVVRHVLGHWDSYFNKKEKKTFLKKDYFHHADDFEGCWYVVPSYHDQLMYPFSLNRKDYSIITWTYQSFNSSNEPVYINSRHKLIPPNEEIFFGGKGIKNQFSKERLVEPEIVHFKNIKALCLEFDPSMYDVEINKIKASNTEDNQGIKFMEECRDRVLEIVEYFVNDKL